MNKTSEGQTCQQTNNTQRNEETNKQTISTNKHRKGKKQKETDKQTVCLKPTNGCDDFACLTVCWPSELRAYYV